MIREMFSSNDLFLAAHIQFFKIYICFLLGYDKSMSMCQIIDVNIWGFRQSSSVYWCMYCLQSNCLKPHMFILIICHAVIGLSYPTTPLRTYFYLKFKNIFPLTSSKPIPIKCINIQSYCLKRHMLYLLLYTTFACMSSSKYFLRASIRGSFFHTCNFAL